MLGYKDNGELEIMGTKKKVTHIKSTTKQPTAKDEAKEILKDIEKIQQEISVKSKLVGNLSRALRNVINGTPKNQLNEPLIEKEIQTLLGDIKNKIKLHF